MTIEVTTFEINSGVVSIFGTDCSEEHLQWIERTRDDSLRELEFAFDSTNDKEFTYLRKWLKSQKAVKQAEPDTWGNALRAVIGSIVTINGKYLVRE